MPFKKKEPKKQEEVKPTEPETREMTKEEVIVMLRDTGIASYEILGMLEDIKALLERLIRVAGEETAPEEPEEVKA